MVVYWDVAAAWSFALDYILLLGTARLAGRPVRRRRVALGAALGAAYSAAALALPLPLWTITIAMALVCFAAFGRAPRLAKLVFLFALLSCALGGCVLLLGRAGGVDALRAGLPWGVFFAATGITYLLLTLIFRNGVKREAGDFVSIRVTRGGKSVEARLLRDTGNTLTDPLTGEGVPVVEEKVLKPLFEKGNGGGEAYIAFTTLHIRTVSGADGTLRAFRCDELCADGRSLGARLVAVSPDAFGVGYQGLWYDEIESERMGGVHENGLGASVEKNS